MKVIDEIIASIGGDSPVKEVRSCIFWTAVVSRNCGLGSTLTNQGPHHVSAPVQEAGSLTERTARELALYANSSSLPEASIGIAAINSLLEIEEKRCSERNAFEVLQERGKGKRVAIVGHFPFVPKLKEIASQCWVLERRPGEGDLPANETERILPEADVVGITGTTLINHTFESLMKLCRGSFIVLLGPSTPLSPVLFDYGVDVISGVKVIETDLVLKGISEGATFRQMQGVRLLTLCR